MRNEKSKQHTLLYIIDLIAIFAGLAAISFALYITPYLLFGVQYYVPQFVFQAAEFLKLHHDITGFSLIFTLLAPFYLTAALLFFISSRLTMEYETETHQVDLTDLKPDTSNLTSEKKDNVNPVILYLFLVVLTVAFLLFVEWLITRSY